MIHMEREQHSEYEGPPLPFFALLPKSQSFWFTRIVLEPCFVFRRCNRACRTFSSCSPALAAYLHFAALALAMKNFISWFRILGILAKNHRYAHRGSGHIAGLSRTRPRKRISHPCTLRASRKTSTRKYAGRQRRTSRMSTRPIATTLNPHKETEHMKLTEKQQKALWIAGGVSPSSTSSPNVVFTVRQQARLTALRTQSLPAAIPAATPC